MKKIYLYIIYPLFTIWFASQANLIRENLSIAGSKPNMYFIFILWAISLVIAFSFGMHECIHKSIHSKYLIPLLAIACLLFLIAVILPYQPENNFLISELHIHLSFIGLFLLLIVISLMVISLKMTTYIYPYDFYLVFIYMCALGIFGANYMSVNSLVEIFLAIILPIYLIHLGNTIKK